MSKQFQINELIGEYRVTSFLGKGGMGEVYLGVHEKLGRAAAIKILGADTTDESFKTRFFNEARLQASLHHPNIATLYDFQEHGSELLIFMEYVDGESLDDLVRRRAFAVEETLGVFAAICEAVGYMHRNGIVHRDIKSQNVKLTAAGAVKLLDFGIAKDLASDGLTLTGGVVGTPNYLSPEQLEGKPATPRSDVWALGVVLYEMLTGVRPFVGDNIGSLVLSIATTKFTPPEDINPAVPRAAGNIVRRCLKKDPSGRYESVDALIRDVRSAMGQKTQDLPTMKRTFAFSTVDNEELKTQTRIQRQPEREQPAVVVPSAAPAARMPAKRSGFPMMMIAGGIVFILLLIAGAAAVGIWALSGKPETVKIAEPPSKPPANKDIFGAPGGKTENSRSTKTDAIPDAKTDAKPENGVVKPQTSGEARKIRIDLDEGTAQVLRNGSVLGTTPLDIDVAAGETPTLTLHRDGYEDKEVRIEAGGGKRAFTFSLKPKK